VVKETVVIKTPEGLHARPAAEFVRIAATAGHSVMISKGEGPKVRGDSILSLLSLGVKQGERFTIEVTGSEEVSLIQSLITVVSGANNR
jgi:phosphotransferase system HPr (HPr) family protein